MSLKTSVSYTVRFCEKKRKFCQLGHCDSENAECPEPADQLDYKNIAFFNENDCNLELRFVSNKFSRFPEIYEIKTNLVRQMY